MLNDRVEHSLPEGWVWTTIGQVTLSIEKVSPGQKPDVTFVYIDISSIDNSIQKIVEPKEYLGLEAPSRARQLVHANDVVFSTVRTYLKNVALVPEIYDGQIASTGFSVLRGSDVVNAKFLFYYTLTDEFLSPLNELQRGTSYPAVRDGDVRVQPFPLPPLPEQERIVARLEELLSDLEAGVAALERVRAGAKLYKASVLKAACEGRLFGDKPQGLPVGWQTIEFKKIIRRLKNGFFYGRPSSEPIGIPILRISAVRPLSVNLNEPRYIPDLEESQVIDYFLKKGDLLFTRYNGNLELVGACGMVRELSRPTIYPDKLIRVNVDQDAALPDYIEIYFATQTARQYVESRVKSTAGQHGIAGGDIKSILVTLPPLEEQRRIVAEVERRLESARAVESAVELGLKRAGRLRQAVLKAAFEGKL